MKKDGSPGPGQYKIPSKISDLPAYAMPNRPEQYKYIWENKHLLIN